MSDSSLQQLADTIRLGINRELGFWSETKALADLDELSRRLQEAETALTEIRSKPYRAEEVVARWAGVVSE